MCDIHFYMKAMPIAGDRGLSPGRLDLVILTLSQTGCLRPREQGAEESGPQLNTEQVRSVDGDPPIIVARPHMSWGWMGPNLDVKRWRWTEESPHGDCSFLARVLSAFFARKHYKMVDSE